MRDITVNDLFKSLEKATAEGHGNKVIYLSDDEGNGYHKVVYHLTSVTDLDKQFHGLNKDTDIIYIVLFIC